MEDNVGNANILDMIYELQNISNMPIENVKELEKDIRLLLNKKRDLMLVDPNFKRELTVRTDRLKLVNTEDIEVVASSIDHGSLIFFVEKAGAYIIYGSNQVFNYVQDVNTILKNEKIYEVVRDNNPQKLVFVLNCNIPDPQLENLKLSILKYIKNNSSYNVFNSDMKVFRDSTERNSKIEILVTTVIFNNLTEKMKFIAGFKEFLLSDTDSVNYNTNMVANNLEFYGKKAKGLDAQLYKTASQKIQIAKLPKDDDPEKIFDSMVTPIVINNYVVNNVNNISGDYIMGENIVVNKTVQTQKTVLKTIKKKTIKNFCEYIYTTKPEWFIENDTIEWSIIEDFYREYFNDKHTPKQTISKKLNGILYTASGRSNSGTTKKRLCSYVELKKNAGF